MKPASENDLKQLRKAFSDLEDTLLQLVFYFDVDEDAEDVKNDILNCLSKYVRDSVDAQAAKDLEKVNINSIEHRQYWSLTTVSQQIFKTKGGYNKAMNFLNQLIEVIKHTA